MPARVDHPVICRARFSQVAWLPGARCSRATLRVIDRIEHDLAAAGDLLPLTWYDVILELNAAPDGRLRQRDLARKVVLTRSGISRLIDRLEAAELVSSSPNPNDRRGDLVTLTEAGRAALRATWPAYAKGIQEHFARHLTAEEAQVLSSCTRADT